MYLVVVLHRIYGNYFGTEKSLLDKCVLRADRPLNVRPFISITKWSKSVIERWEKQQNSSKSVLFNQVLHIE